MKLSLIGTKLRVELNDKVIHDTDLATHAEPVLRHDGKPAPPIKDRPRRGRIGFPKPQPRPGPGGDPRGENPGDRSEVTGRSVCLALRNMGSAAMKLLVCLVLLFGITGTGISQVRTIEQIKKQENDRLRKAFIGLGDQTPRKEVHRNAEVLRKGGVNAIFVLVGELEKHKLYPRKPFIRYHQQNETGSS